MGEVSVEGPVTSHGAFLVRDRGVSQEFRGVRVARRDVNLGCLRVVPDVYLVDRYGSGVVVRRRHQLLLMWRDRPGYLAERRRKALGPRVGSG